MTDSNRLVAPFLAPEIISRILDSYLPKNPKESINETTQRNSAGILSKFSLISSAWSNETRRRIFSHVYLTSVDRLDEFLLLMNEFVGESITLLYFGVAVLTSIKLLRILKSTPNLRIFTMSSLVKLDGILESLQLPRLTCLTLKGDSTAHLALENLKIIMASAPNLESLTVHGTSVNIRYRSFPHIAEAWSNFSSNLKNLEIKNDASAVMSGALIPLENVNSITNLILHSDLSHRYKPFFKSIGLNLRSLTCPAGESEQFLGYLNGLKILKLTDKNFQISVSSTFFSKLPESLKSLEMYRARDIGGLFLAYSLLPVSEQQLNLELLKLEALKVDIDMFPNLDDQAPTLNLAHLPRTRSLAITTRPYYGDHLEESLNELKIEQVKFEKLIVSVESFDNFNIEVRCKALGIQLKQSYD